MFSRKFDRNSKDWKQFVAWSVGTLVMPLVAFPLINDAAPDLEFDIPVILFFGFCWGIVSFLLHRFVKENIK